MTTVLGAGLSHVLGFRCVKCEAEYETDCGHLTCPACGREGILDVLLDHDEIAKRLTRESLAANPDRTHWRYAPLLPLVNPERRPPLAVGGSPLYSLPGLAAELGLNELLAKDDGLNPTASLKDRASSVGVAKAMEAGAPVITCASTGNAASSLAGAAASVGMEAHIFVPARAPEAKVAQLLIFGAHVYVVEGSYEDAFELSMACAERLGWYNRNSGINPYLVEGKKTVGLEIAEQTLWNPPDWVFASVGDGCSIWGLWKGLREAELLGLTHRSPRLVGVQAAGAAPIAEAAREGRDVIPGPADTLADSIAVGTPRNWRKALRAVSESGGRWLTVTDDEILAAMRALGAKAGIFGEPAGVASHAGVVKAAQMGLIGANDRVAFVVSGNGLKDTASAIRATGAARRVPPDIEAVMGMIQRRD
jgi:threonine synthase